MLVNPGPGEENRRDIDRYCAEHARPFGLAIHFVERPLLCRWLQHGRLGRVTPLYYAGYASWQRAALRAARRLHGQAPFDLVHQLTIVSYREPGYLWKLGIPFVWGPIGGAGNVPWRFLSSMSWRDRIFHGARNIVNAIQARSSRRPRRAAARAAHIWGATTDDVQMVRKAWKRRADPLLEVGCTPSPMARSRRPREGESMRVIWSGKHIGRKALPLLLHALARTGGALRLIVLGSGPLTSQWRAIGEKLGVGDRIRWLGELSHQEALRHMDLGHVFVSTSVLESTSTVVMEALSLGLPVICHDACGMASAVTERCGIKVPLISPNRSVEGFASALTRLIRDPELVESLSEGALERSRELTWQRKARAMVETYETILADARRDRARGGAEA
jgi:glycosyltransferase involved in cell wall biosynthesis